VRVQKIQKGRWACSRGAFVFLKGPAAFGRRGAYGPVLTHGPRVVVAYAAGAEALVGVLKIIKNVSYNKTREPP